MFYLFYGALHICYTLYMDDFYEVDVYSIKKLNTLNVWHYTYTFIIFIYFNYRNRNSVLSLEVISLDLRAEILLEQTSICELRR